jgi:hypothetical protein
MDHRQWVGVSHGCGHLQFNAKKMIQWCRSQFKDNMIQTAVYNSLTKWYRKADHLQFCFVFVFVVVLIFHFQSIFTKHTGYIHTYIICIPIFSFLLFMWKFIFFKRRRKLAKRLQSSWLEEYRHMMNVQSFVWHFSSIC